MNRKDILTRKKQRLEKRRDTLKARAKASADANEVRAINDQLEEIMEDLSDINDELAAIEEEERSHAVPAANAQQNGAQQHNAGIVASFAAAPAAGTRSEEEDPRATLEYRKFDSATLRMVKAFQADAGLTIDGIAGRKTIRALGGTYR